MAQLEDTIHEKQNWHWRNTMRPVKLFSMDGRAAAIYFAMIPFLAHLWAWILIVINTVIFMYLGNKGMTFPVAMRAFRTWILGQKRPAWISLRHRRMIDYG